MSVPPMSYGIWQDMVAEAGGMTALALQLSCSLSWVRKLSRGARNPRGPHAALALAFARDRGVRARAYEHPSTHGAYLVSAADGWWTVVPGPGAWGKRQAIRVPARVLPRLALLEVPFDRFWAICTAWNRPPSATSPTAGNGIPWDV